MADTNDVEKLQAEREALERRVEQLEAKPARRRRLATVFSAIFLVLAVLLFSVAVPGTWARRTLLDTDRYVATVAPLARDAAVQEYLARTVTEEVFTALQVEDRLAEALRQRSPRLAFLAGPIANGVQSFVQDQLHAVLASETFATSWEAANRFAHAQLIAVLEGDIGAEGETVQVQGDKVVLNLLPLVNQGLAAMTGVVTNIVGHPVTLPQITGDEIPSEAVTRLESALGVDLPEGFGTIVVYDASQLQAVQRVVDLASRAVVAFALLFLVCAAIALWISRRRRRTLIQLTVALLVVLVVERRFSIAEGDVIVNRVKPENQAAARAVVDQVLGALLRYTGWLLAFALLVLVIALITGPYPWAVRIRGWTADIAAAAVGAVRGRRAAGSLDWVAGHRDVLMLGGAGVGVLLLLLANLSLWGFVGLLVVFGLYELVIYRAGASVR
jgi:hypothetical protein